MGNSYGGRLPQTIAEAQAVANHWGVQPQLEEGATQEALSKASQTARLLHLACHGEFHAQNPLFSGLALEDGWLTTLEVFNLQLQTSLVTLSACQTGRAAIGAGDELSGLMCAFLAAGAASLLLSHWTVADQSTAAFMARFYQELSTGASKEEALRSAQRRLLAGREEEEHDWRHPYFWAPFFLVGAGGVL